MGFSIVKRNPRRKAATKNPVRKRRVITKIKRNPSKKKYIIEYIKTYDTYFIFEYWQGTKFSKGRATALKFNSSKAAEIVTRQLYEKLIIPQKVKNYELKRIHISGIRVVPA